jgi:hypothetical protein
MGQSIMIAFMAVMLSPALLLISLAAYLIARRLRLFPPGTPEIVNFIFVGSLSVGALSLHGTGDMFIRMPAQLQRDYLGRTVASPFQLRNVVVDFQIQDPSAEWLYALSASDAEALRRRCAFRSRDPRRSECILYSHQDNRSIESASVTDANQLRISWNLW